MFNIVKRKDFMLGKNVSKEEAEKARDDYGKEYVVVQQLDEPSRRARPSQTSGCKPRGRLDVF